MRFNLDPFDVELPEFGDRTTVSKLELVQLEFLIKRQEQYLDFLKKLYYCLNFVNDQHYKECPFHILSKLKDYLQVFTWSREALYKIIPILEKDIFYYKQQFEALKIKKDLSLNERKR